MDSSQEGCFMIVAAFIAVILFFIGLAIGHDGGHKQGQIDALSGKIRYKLVEQSDKSTQWVEVKEAGHDK